MISIGILDQPVLLLNQQINKTEQIVENTIKLSIGNFSFDMVINNSIPENTAWVITKNSIVKLPV